MSDNKTVQEFQFKTTGLNELIGGLRDVERSVVKSGQASEGALHKMRNLLESQRTQARETVNQLKEVKQHMATMVSVQERLLTGFQQQAALGASAQMAVSTTAKGATASLDKLSSSTARATSLSRNLHEVWRGMTAAAGQIWLSWSSNFAAMAAGLAPVAATMKSISQQREFGWQMAQVGAAAEIGDARVKELGDSILALGGGKYTQTPIEMANSLRVLAQAGLETGEALKAMPSVLNMAMVAGVSDEQAATFAVGMIEPFGLRGEDGKVNQAKFQSAIDQTAKAAAVSQTSIEKMMESMKQAAPAADKFGLSVTDVSAALAALARVNIVGSSAGTAFRNFMTDVGGRTAKSRKALEALGLSAYNAQGMIKPFVQIVEELQDKFKGMNDQDKQKWLRSFLDERGMRTADILLNMTTQEFRALHQEILRGAENMGYTTAQAERLGETSEGAFRKMQAAWSTTFVQVGQDAESPFKGLLISLKELANQPQTRKTLTDIATLLINTADAGVKVVGVLTNSTSLIAGFSSAWLTFKGLGVVGTFTGLTASITASATATTAATAVTGRLQTAWAAFMATVRANPIGLVISAAVGVGIWALTRARKEALDLSAELRALPEDLGAVSTSVYSAFNTSGAGLRLDRLLGYAGDIKTDMARGVKDATDAYLLSSEQTNEAFANNLRKINEVFGKEVAQLASRAQTAHQQSADQMQAQTRQRSQVEIEQEVLLLDRKNTLLKSQLENVDKHLAGVKELSEEDKNTRMAFEQEIFDNTVRLNQLRTELMVRQLQETRAAAEKELGLFDRFTRAIGNEFSVDGRVQTVLANRLNVSGAKFADGSIEARMQAQMLANGWTAQQAIAANLGGMNAERVAELASVASNSALMKAYREQIEQSPEKAIAQIGDILQLLGNMEKIYAAFGYDLPKGFDVANKSQQSFLLMAQQAAAKQQTAQTAQSTFNARELSEPNQTKTEKASNREARKTTNKSYSAYESPLAKLDAEQAKQARERAKKENDKQVKLFGYSDEAVFKSYQESVALQLQAQNEQKVSGYRKTLGDLRRSVADGKYAPQDLPKVQADIVQLENLIRASSPKGEVDLGVQARTFTTTYKREVSDDAPTNGEGRAINAGKVTPQMWAAIEQSAKQIGMRPNDLAAIISFETGGTFNPSIRNPKSSATGLIQFTGATAKGLGTSIDKLANMSFESQMQYVVRYFQQRGFRPDKQASLGLGYDTVTGTPANGYRAGTEAYRLNSVWDANRNGVVERGEAVTADAFKRHLGDYNPSSPRVKSVSTDKNGKRFETVEEKTTVYEPVRATNAQDGAMYTQEVDEAIKKEQERLAVQREQQIFLTDELPKRQHMLKVAQDNLKAAQAAGALTKRQAYEVQDELKRKEVELSYEEKMAKLLRDNELTDEERVRASEKITDELNEQTLALMRQAEQRQNANTFDAGVRDSLNSLISDAEDMHKFGKNVTSNITTSISDMFVQMTLSGKQSFRDLASSVLANLAKIFAQMAILQAMTATLKAFGFGADANSNAKTGGGNSSAGGFIFGILQKVGETMLGGITAHARGGAFTNGSLTAYANGGVVNSPTYFGYNGGRGLMGEQGSEAIMPLSRMANGDLGVAVSGSFGGGAVINAPVTVTVNMNADGSSDTDVSTTSGQAKQLGEAISMVVKQEVAKMVRPNGMIGLAIRQGVR